MVHFADQVAVARALIVGLGLDGMSYTKGTFVRSQTLTQGQFGKFILQSHDGRNCSS